MRSKSMKNFSFSRVWSVAWRYAIMLPRDSARYFDMFYWPLMDVMLWSFTGAWMKQSQSDQGLGLVFIIAPIFWQALSRLTLEIPRNILEEVWGGSVFNLVATPLHASEWLSAVILVSFVSQIITVLFLALVAIIFYQCNLFALGFLALPLLLPLVLFGIALGVFCAGLIIYKGSRIGTLAWAVPWLLAPISGIYYPLDVLPSSLRYAGLLFPPAHIFGVLRGYLMSGYIAWDTVIFATVLACGYMPLAFGFFYHMYRKSATKGFARLTRL